MASSALLRRLTSRIPTVPRRTITSAAAAPWLAIRPNCGTTDGDTLYRFYCYAKDKIYNFFPRYEEMIPWEGGLNILNSYVQLVGSSHGWLATYDHTNSDLFISDPTTHHHIKLPAVDADAMGQVHNVVLHEREGKAVIIFGSENSLALCLPRLSRGWTPFGGGGYESVVYSTAHRRLLCLTSTLKLEAWDLGGGEEGPPRLDRVTQLVNPNPDPERPGLKTLSNIVCDEQSGQLLVLLRHVRTGGGRWVRRTGGGRWVKREYVCPTVGFEAYKVDSDGGTMVKMEDSLEGMTIFLGINPPIAARGIAGIKPDSIYFADDERACRIHDDYDVGIFDLKKGVAVTLKPQFDYVDSVWFVPH